MSDDDDRRRRIESTGHGPSTPSTLRFDPFATAIGIFSAISIPVVVVGYTRPGGPSTTIIVVGILVGVIAGLLVGLWVARRAGRVWRGPQL